MIQRIFYPVGQGAFYSERHENCNIVYDCGTHYFNRGKKGIKNTISQSFSKDEIIDILFISHFDYDHVSLIEHLKKSVKKIRFVVIPLLHRNEKILLSNVFKALGEKALVTLVEKPKEFFGAETHIISIQPSSEEGINKDTSSILLNEINQDPIPSGTPIAIDNGSDWVFIPFNYEYKNRSKEFLNLLKKDYVDNVRNKTNYILNSNIRKKIKSIYTKISGKINQNSMFLYSGPYEKNSKCYQGVYWDLRLLSPFSTPSKHPFPTISKYSFIKINKYPLKDSLPCQYKVACLYTGDGDLNKVDIEKIYRDYWNLIGTIQIPHHGGLKSFNESILKDQYFLCPISVGENNSYGHPSGKVISKILSYASFPLLVTEDTDSKFIETIKKINN